MKKTLFWVAALAMAPVFVACDAQADDMAALEARAAKPGHGGYWDASAMLEKLPEAVKLAFDSTEYAQAPWVVTDVEFEKSKKQPARYKIEAQKTDSLYMYEAELEYLEDGSLLKCNVEKESFRGKHDDEYYGDDHRGNYTDSVAGQVGAWVEAKYPGATITDVEYEHRLVEVEAVYEGSKMEMGFAPDGTWLYSKTEIAPANAPELVTTALAASEYATYAVCAIDLCESPAASFYRVELRGTRCKVKVDIALDGTINGLGNGGKHDNGHGTQPGNPGNVNANDSVISAFIAEKYPAAQIVDFDFEHGYYEVDFIHDGAKKEAHFNTAKEWLSTYTKVAVSALPQAVADAIAASEWASYKVCSANFVELPDASYYYVELKHGPAKAKLKIAADGTML